MTHIFSAKTAQKRNSMAHQVELTQAFKHKTSLGWPFHQKCMCVCAFVAGKQISQEYDSEWLRFWGKQEGNSWAKPFHILSWILCCNTTSKRPDVCACVWLRVCFTFFSFFLIFSKASGQTHSPTTVINKWCKTLSARVRINYLELFVFFENHVAHTVTAVQHRNVQVSPAG